MKQLKPLGFRRLIGIIIMLFLLALPFYINHNVQNETKTTNKFTASYVTLENHNPDYWKKDGLFGNYIREYELREFRDRNAKHFPSEDGNVAVISAGSIHYLDERGDWQEIDTRIRESKVQGYAFENTRNGIRTWYPDETGESIEVGFDNEFLSIGSNMTLSWESEGGKVLKRQSSTFSFPEADSNKVVYHAFFPGVDNEFEIEPDKVKNKLILKSRPAAEGDYLVLSEQLVLPQGWTVKLYEESTSEVYETKHGFRIVDNLGMSKLTVPAPEVYSVAQQKFPIEELPAKWILKQEGHVLTLKMQVEQSWLQDPNLKYPIVLDPTINTGGNKAGFVSSGNTQNPDHINQAAVGRSNSNNLRAYLQWNTGSIPDDANINLVRGLLTALDRRPSRGFDIKVNQIAGAYGNYWGGNRMEGFADMGTGPTYYSFDYYGEPETFPLWGDPIDYGAQARADLKSRLSENRFQVGLAASSSLYCQGGSCTWAEFSHTASIIVVTYCIPYSVISQPTDQTICKNGDVRFSVTARGTHPIHNKKWQYSSDNGVNWNDLVDGGSAPAISGSNIVYLSLSNVPESWENYLFRYGASNSCGNRMVWTNSVKLNFTPLPSVTSNPQAGSTCEGGNITFNASFSDATDYHWQQSTDGGANWADLSESQTFKNVTSNTLSILNIPAHLNGSQYRLRAYNDCEENVSNAAALSLTLLPSIAIDPDPVHVKEGGTASFTADLNSSTHSRWVFTVDGGANWIILKDKQHPDGFEISGNTLTIRNVPLSWDGREYALRGYNDGCGPVYTNRALLTVTDCAPPVATCKAITVQLDANNSVDIVASDVDGGSTANCGLKSLTVTPNDFNCSTLGDQTVELTITDIFNTTSTCKANVTVQDKTKPVPDVANLSAVSGECSATISSTPTATDNCEGTIVGTTADPLTYSTQGTHTVTWSFDDGNGNVETQTQLVIIEDKTPPVAKCKKATIFLDKNGKAVAFPSDFDDGSFDACGKVDISFLDGKDEIDFTCVDRFPQVTILVTDESGNTSTCTESAIIRDNIPPTAKCKDLTMSLSPAGIISFRSFILNNNSFDNCSIQLINNRVISKSCEDIGTFPVTLAFSDGNKGVISTCTSNVTIVDDLDPIAKCQDVTIQLGESGTALLDPDQVNLESSDNCGISDKSLDKTSFDCSNLGANTVKLTVTDNSNNSHSCEAEVTVKDEVAPQAICKRASIYLDKNGRGTAVPSDFDNGSFDACGKVDISFLDGRDIIDLRCGDSRRKVTILVTDESGNTSTCTTQLIPRDIIPPIAICKNITVATGENGTAIITAQELDDGSTDNCGPLSFEFSDGTDEKVFQCGESGLDAVIIVKDDNGNESSCTSNITVIDDTPPKVNCKDITVELDKNGFGYFLNSDVDDGASDNCQLALPLYSTFPYALSCNSLRKFSHTLTVKDVSGNRYSCTAQVTVVDRIAPKAICQDVTIQLDEKGQAALEPNQIDMSSSDNCGIVDWSIDKTSFDCSSLGTHTVKLTVSDQSNNSHSCESKVTVKDDNNPCNRPPVAVCKDITISLDPSCEATITPDQVDGGSSDPDQDKLTFSLDKSTFSKGTYSVELTVSDGDLFAKCTAKVTAEDVTKPVPDVVSLAIINVECAVSLSSAPTATDNCEGTIIGITNDPLSYSSQGTHIITWIFDDGNGNSVTQTQTVIIKDVTAPVPDVATLPIITGNCEAGLEPPFATDNCEGQILGTTTDPLYFDKEGTYTVTWVYDDGNGNTSSQVQTIVIEDNIAPVPDRNNLPTLRAQCGLTVSTIPTATDRCVGTIVGTTSDPLTYNTQGIHIITWTFDDGNGNSVTQTQRVVIRDNKAPVPDQASLPTLTGSCSVMITQFPTATDNCAGSVTATTDSPLEFDREGTFAILWNYDDGNGNTSTQTQWVIVGGDVAPNALCKNISMPMTGNGSVNIKAVDIDDGSFDDCSSVTLMISPVGGSIFGNSLPPAPSMDLYCKDGKEQNLMLSVTNEKGNTAHCQAKVTLLGTDTDNDGILDSCDNCPDTYNPDQKDDNNNGKGDAFEENANPDPNPGGWGGWSLKKQGDDQENIITELKAFPNPFQEEVNLSFNLSQEEKTTVEIFNIQGQRVHTLLSELAPKGEHRVLWDGKDQNGQPLPSGIYLIRLRAGKALINQKVILQK